jgi:hypothetical protein
MRGRSQPGALSPRHTERRECARYLGRRTSRSVTQPIDAIRDALSCQAGDRAVARIDFPRRPGEMLYAAAMNEPSEAELDDLIAQATVDCYNEDEELTGFATMIGDNLAVPFRTTVLGLTVTVRKINHADSGIVAICTRGKYRQAIPILDLPLPDPPPQGTEWIAAYRRWAR